MRNYLSVLDTIERAGTKAWIVGDSTRMIFMGIQPANLTFAVEPCDLEALALKLGSSGGVDTGGKFPVLRGSILDMTGEIYLLQGDSIEEDLARRDFSINAIAIRSDGGVVDPFNGRHDIRNRVVRLTGDDVSLLHQDPLRIVRMLRFAAELGMDIFWKSETDVRTFIKSNPDVIRDTPSERWGREILSGMRRCPWNFISLCDGYRLLPFFLKELEALKTLTDKQGRTFFDRTLQLLRRIQDFIKTHRPLDEDLIITLSALFVHIERQSQEPALAITARYLKDWNAGSEISNQVLAVLENYRDFFEPRTEKELCSSVLAHGSEATGTMIDFAFCYADVDESKSREILTGNHWKLKQVLRRFNEVKRKTDGETRFLKGDEVMELLNLRPGRKVGEVLHALDMAVGTGVVSSKEGAKAWVLKSGPAL
ncbi:MAG: CCA tRNA nucleotidyltransferase [Fretibacterium sp.]|nr:CCA tRNA nucleotidyltransferase [Fretibacterium sp.]